MRHVKITGLGRYLPKTLVNSSELDIKLGFAPGTVEQKSGLVQRHFASAEETTSFMGAQAAIEAVHQAGIALSDIDLIIGACGAGEQPLPCTATLIQKQLGLAESGIPCFDINSTCLSFLTALDTISYLIDAGRYQRVLIVSSEIPSLGLNWQDLETCTIFGDGAAACVVEKSQGSNRIISSRMETQSIGADFCRVEAGGTRIPPSRPFDHERHGCFIMNGKKVFKLASHMLAQTHELILQEAQVTLEDIDWIIPHQASQLALHHMRKRLNMPQHKVVDIFVTHGNQMAASIPNALYVLQQSQQLERGQLVYLIGTGAGLSSAGLLLEY